MCFAADKKLRSLRSLHQSFFVLQIFSPAGTVHFLLHIYMDHACCICNMTTHTTLSWLNSFLFRRQTSLTPVSYTVRLQDLLQCHLLEKGNERAKENCSAVQVTLTRALKNNRAAKNAIADQTHRRCLENQQSQSMRHQKARWCSILRETPSA